MAGVRRGASTPTGGDMSPTRLSDDEWLALYDSMPDPHIVLEPVRDGSGCIADFRYALANTAACAFHGLPPGALAGMSLLALHPAAIETGLLAAYVELVDTGRPMLMDDYAYPQEVLGGQVRRYDVRAVRVERDIGQTWRDVTDRYEASHVARAAEERFRTLVDAFQEPVLTYAAVRDEHGVPVDLVYTYLNSAAERLLRLSPVDVLGARLSVLFPTVVERGILAAYLEPITTRRPRRIEVLGFDDETVPGSFELSAYPYRDEVIVMARDLSERLADQVRLADSERRYRLLAQNSMDLVFSLDTHAVIDWVSPSVTSLLGYEPSELTGQFGGILINAEDLPLLLEAATAARGGSASSCRIRMVTKAGDDCWVEATPRTLRDEAGELVGGVIGVRDIREEIAARHALEHEVAFDGITGLAKRSLALERIEEIVATRTEPGWALLCVGVDGMTAINQGYTYAAGDAVLVAVAHRLVDAAGAPDRVARIAGDEFIVLMRDIVTPADAAEAAQRILDAVHGPVAVGESHVDVTACIGIAVHRSEDAEELLRDATAAMRQASRGGTDRWQFLDGDIQTATRSVLSLQAALKVAVDEDEIQPWLMPLVRLADGEVAGYEALARWRRSDGSIAGPDEFIEVAERSPLITALDRSMLRQVVDLLERLPAHQHVSVNVSGQTLANANLPAWVCEELARTGVDPKRLHLEVTETSLFQVTDSVLNTMTEIAQTGVSWWVDDFGTGYSSVSHLRDLPIAGLKLDRSFTQEVTSPNSQTCRIAKGLFGLAHGLGLVTIAEGVETAEQAQVLAEHGWQYGQGWQFGRAQPGIPAPS